METVKSSISTLNLGESRVDSHCADDENDLTVDHRHSSSKPITPDNHAQGPCGTANLVYSHLDHTKSINYSHRGIVAIGLALTVKPCMVELPGVEMEGNVR